MFKQETIVCIAAADWFGMWARAQQLMTRFARQGNRVLYVDPPITLLSPLKNPALFTKRREKLTRVDEHIYVYSPPVMLPFGNMYRQINKINQYRLFKRIRRVLKKIDYQPTLLWSYLPASVDLVSHLNIPFLCYDCVDEHAAFPGFVKRDTVEEMEKRLLRLANATFASARELYDRKCHYASNMVFVPNGADVNHFAQARQDIPLAPEVADLPKPVVGYIGAVSQWMEQDMLVALAQKHPDWSVVLVGPVDTDVGRMEALPNVYLLGKRDYKVLPGYLKAFDVAVIPFKINDLTIGVNPVKLYEYLAAGKPVVSSTLPEVRPFVPTVQLADTPEDFVAQVEKAVLDNSPAAVAQRVTLAEENSWENRAEVMSDVILTAQGKKSK